MIVWLVCWRATTRSRQSYKILANALGRFRPISSNKLQSQTDLTQSTTRRVDASLRLKSISILKGKIPGLRLFNSQASSRRLIKVEWVLESTRKKASIFNNACMQTCTKPVNKLLTTTIIQCMETTTSKSSVAKSTSHGRTSVERATSTSRSRHISNEKVCFKTISITHANRKAVAAWAPNKGRRYSLEYAASVNTRCASHASTFAVNAGSTYALTVNSNAKCASPSCAGSAHATAKR